MRIYVEGPYKSSAKLISNSKHLLDVYIPDELKLRSQNKLKKVFLDQKSKFFFCIFNKTRARSHILLENTFLILICRKMLVKHSWLYQFAVHTQYPCQYLTRQWLFGKLIKMYISQSSSFFHDHAWLERSVRDIGHVMSGINLLIVFIFGHF